MNGARELARSQHQFAAHVRDPERVPGPPDIEPRRMKIYSELVYNNVEGFLSGGFPVLRSLLSEADWSRMVRGFLVKHRAQTPYFLEIGQEFLQFLQQQAGEFGFLPPFALELAHYEWIELALDVAPDESSAQTPDPAADLLDGMPLLSPLAWVLAYHYPVHRIRAEFQPTEPLAQPVYLVVYRNALDEVKFLEVNAVTARLLELLRDDGETATGRGALQQLTREMPALEAELVLENGRASLEQMRDLGIILGACQAADS